MNRHGRTATDWSVSESVARLFSGAITEAEACAIKERMAEDVDFRDTFESATCAIADLEALADDPDILALSASSTLSVRARVRRNWPGLAMAATLLLAVVIGVVSLSYFNGESQNDSNIQRYVTRISEQKAVKLTDGSHIVLNTGSQVMVDIGAHERRVTLVRGEVFFDVKKDAERPFIVDLGARSVTVLGTEFDVLKTPDKYRIAVIAGEISIHQAEETASLTAPLVAASEGDPVNLELLHQRRVQAGWVAEYNVESNKMLAYQPDNMNRLHSWRTGLIEFYSEPLYKVIKELNRYSAKKILIEDTAIMNLEVYAGVDMKELNTALVALEEILPIKVITHFDRIVIVGSDVEE